MNPRRSQSIVVRMSLLAALVAFLVTTVGIIYQGYATAQEPTPQPAEAGTQPLIFSHQVHTGEYEIACQYCHAYARRGPVAGIPSVQRCVGCHSTIAAEQPEIVRLMEYWAQREPIPWIRTHDLPDHVRFTHKRHVLAGVTCQVCHGDVDRMGIAIQTAPLTMGWCVECHAEREAPKDCLVCHQ